MKKQLPLGKRMQKAEMGNLHMRCPLAVLARIKIWIDRQPPRGGRRLSPQMALVELAIRQLEAEGL